MSNQEKESDVHYTKSNETLEVTITKKPHCQIKFDIKATPKAVEAAYQKAFKNVSKEVTIPGFRKGRGPDKMILERYHDAVHKEFIDLVLQIGFNDAIHLTHIHPLKDGHIKRPVVHHCSRETGAHFTIEFEARPTIPTVKLEELEVKKAPRPTISDQELQNALQNLQLQFATYDPVEDRAVQADDFVNVSVTLVGDHPRTVVDNQRTQVNSTGLPSWLRDKVIGLNAGESAEGMTEQDPNLIEEDPNFKSLPFTITVHSIWSGNLPPVDDELAKRVGLETVEDLRSKINERLSQEIEEDAFKQEVHAIEQLLIEHYPIDLPQSYIDTNREERLNNYLAHLKKEKQDFSQEDYQEILQTVEQNTISNLQIYFLVRKIASDYNVTVDNQDTSQELSRQVALISSGRSSLDLNNKENFQEQLHDLAMDRKIKQCLVNHVKFKD